MRQLLVKASLAIGLLVISLSAGAQQAGSSYSIQNLGSLRSDGAGDVIAYGINRQGQVAGASLSDSGQHHAFLWDKRQGMTDLQNRVTNSGFYSYAYGLNDNTQIAGKSEVNGADNAFLYLLSVQDLGTLGGPNSQTNAINGNGDGAGQAQTPAGSWHAFLFTSGMVDLGTLGGAWSGATAVNDALQVAGWSYTASGPTRAFLWQGGSMTDLGTLGGPQSGANGINESGQVVGWADIELQLGGKYIYHAFLYSSANGMQDLGTINGFPYSDADAVNTAGVVVGYVSTGRFVGTRHAFVWDPVNGMQDLNSLIPAGTGWLLQEATGINARGQICGYGTLGGQVHAFVLSPPGASASPINFDINGDGHTDLLWQNQNDGGVYYWLMDNTTILGGNYLSPPNLVSPEWQIVGTPDLNGDGHPDLLWQNQVDGAVYYWLMDGPQVTSGGLLVPANTIDLNWKIVGTPDLNGDGSPDILWQNQANGGVYYWLMNGVQVVSGSFLVPPGQVDPSWQIVSTPDLNGDGSADLLWENSADGAVFYTLLNGIQLVSGGFLAAPNTIDPSWHIAATLDINGDGYTDILWENSVDAGVYYWLMNGTGYLSGDYLVAPYVINPSAGWRIVAPH